MTLSRRGFLRAGAGTVGIASTTGIASAAGTPDFGGYLDDARGGTFEDLRGRSQVTITVGGGDAGLAFLPTAVWIDPDTTVTFEWVSAGHNVLPEDQPDGASWEGHEPIEGSGFTYDHTFETTGIYKYYCRPHKPLGMLGGIAVGDDVPTTTPTPTPNRGNGGGFELPTNPFGTTFLGSLFGVVGVAAALVLAGDLVSAQRSKSTDSLQASLTSDQREALRNGQSVEVTTEDGQRVTIDPSEE